MKLTQLLHLKVHPFTLKVNLSIREQIFFHFSDSLLRGAGGGLGGEGMGMGLEVQDV